MRIDDNIFTDNDTAASRVIVKYYIYTSYCCNSFVNFNPNMPLRKALSATAKFTMIERIPIGERAVKTGGILLFGKEILDKKPSFL